MNKDICFSMCLIFHFNCILVFVATSFDILECTRIMRKTNDSIFDLHFHWARAL